MPVDLEGKLFDRNREEFEKFLEMIASKIAEKIPVAPEKPAIEEFRRLGAKPFSFYSYPSDGSKKTVDAGVTQLDFYTGKVYLPDGTEEYISDNLRNHKAPYIRSFSLNVDQDVVIWTEDQGRRPVEAGNVHSEIYQNITILYIKTTVSTTFNIWASTHPEAFVSTFKESIVRDVESSVYENFLATVRIDATVPSSEMHGGQKTSTTPGTAVTLGTASCDAVVVKALSGNAGLVYVGDTDTKADQFELNAKEAVSFSLGNIGSVFLDVINSGEGVCYAYLK